MQKYFFLFIIICLTSCSTKIKNDSKNNDDELKMDSVKKLRDDITLPYDTIIRNQKPVYIDNK